MKKIFYSSIIPYDSIVWSFNYCLFPQEKLEIAVVPKSNSAIFWKSVHAGVRLGAVALGGVDVLWRAP